LRQRGRKFGEAFAAANAWPIRLGKHRYKRAETTVRAIARAGWQKSDVKSPLWLQQAAATF